MTREDILLDKAKLKEVLQGKEDASIWCDCIDIELEAVHVVMERRSVLRICRLPAK